MQFRAGMLVISLGLRRGVLWFRRGSGRCFMIKAPWNKPLFSERYGHWTHCRILGFRWGWRD